MMLIGWDNPASMKSEDRALFLFGYLNNNFVSNLISGFLHNSELPTNTAQKMKKSFMENIIFCAV